MSSTLADAAAVHISRDAATFASLPLALARRIFLALPADARGRASCVCRAWRDVLAEPALWTRLDLSVVSLPFYRVKAVLRGAAGRARNQLRQLSQQHVTWGELLSVLNANAGSLRELHLQTVRARDAVFQYFGKAYNPTVEDVMAAAPLLQVLSVEDTRCTWEDAPLMLRAALPFGSLQMRGGLEVHFSTYGRPTGGLDRFGPFAAALADIALQPALSRISVWAADTSQPAVLDALVDAALTRGLRGLRLQSCTPPAAAPLARLLADGSLAVLEILGSRDGAGTPLFDAAGAALVADALRVNTTLTKLELRCTYLCLDMVAAGSVLGALIGHSSLRELRIVGEDTTAENRGALGAALAALVAADAPALRVLDCSNDNFKDVDVAPIVEALPLNRHLRELWLNGNLEMSNLFLRDRMLPAWHAMWRVGA